MTNANQKDVWFFNSEGTDFGPISSLSLRKLVEEGKITAKTLVRKGYDGKWIPARSIRGLSFNSQNERVEDDLTIETEIENVNNVKANEYGIIAIILGSVLLLAKVDAVLLMLDFRNEKQAKLIILAAIGQIAILLGNFFAVWQGMIGLFLASKHNTSKTFSIAGTIISIIALIVWCSNLMYIISRQ